MKKLNKDNTSELKNNPGLYYLHNCEGKKVYVGTSKIIKHRLQSYHEKDDFSVNRTKKKLRENLCFFDVQYMNIKKARNIEKQKKTNLDHNHL
jgi:excinuclease UvrABC nuclease subunit